KCEIRSVIRYLVWKGKTPVEVYNKVQTAYGDKGMNRTSVFKWCREFKNGRTSVHDDQRSGRPSILTDDIVEKIENAPVIILESLICSHVFSIPAMARFKGIFVNRDVTSKETSSSDSP
ncbi:GVQW3 protein, partial [Pseudoatta argentina]